MEHHHLRAHREVWVELALRIGVQGVDVVQIVVLEDFEPKAVVIEGEAALLAGNVAIASLLRAVDLGGSLHAHGSLPS